MILIRRVRGSSMTPTLSPGDIVIGSRGRPRVGSIVVARLEAREVIKRVERIEAGQYYLVGDNRDESTDSRHYGKVDESAILGTIMTKLPRATKPPKLVKSYGALLGRVAALVLVAMALIHLYRIDTFIPILDEALPGGSVMASLVALLIVLSEVFAIPFALRMRLSLLAQIVSGALLVIAPLLWVLVDIWTMSIANVTGQFGEFVSAPSSLWLILLNIVWLVFNYVTLYALGYSRLSTKKLST